MTTLHLLHAIRIVSIFRVILTNSYLCRYILKNWSNHQTNITLLKNIQNAGTCHIKCTIFLGGEILLSGKLDSWLMPNKIFWNLCSLSLFAERLMLPLFSFHYFPEKYFLCTRKKNTSSTWVYVLPAWCWGHTRRWRRGKLIINKMCLVWFYITNLQVIENSQTLCWTGLLVVVTFIQRD